jgi:hypothetical protein
MESLSKFRGRIKITAPYSSRPPSFQNHTLRFPSAQQYPAWYGKMLTALRDDSLYACGNGFLVHYTTIMLDMDTGNCRFDIHDIYGGDFSLVFACLLRLCFYSKVKDVSLNPTRGLIQYYNASHYTK